MTQGVDSSHTGRLTLAFQLNKVSHGARNHEGCPTTQASFWAQDPSHQPWGGAFFTVLLRDPFTLFVVGPLPAVLGLPRGGITPLPGCMCNLCNPGSSDSLVSVFFFFFRDNFFFLSLSFYLSNFSFLRFFFFFSFNRSPVGRFWWNIRRLKTALWCFSFETEKGDKGNRTQSPSLLHRMNGQE